MKHIIIKDILDDLNGHYRMHDALPRFIEINKKEWDGFGAEFKGVYITGLIGGVPVIPLESEPDWTLVV
jgi:hypothetical protein